MRPGASPTGPILPGGAPTITLPKATVQLQPPTQPLGTSFSPGSKMATVQSDDDDDNEPNEGLSNILSIVGFIAALAVLSFQLITANTWITARDNPTPGDWTQLMK